MPVAIDRPWRDTTDLLVIARDVRCAGAGFKCLAQSSLGITSNFTELMLAVPGIVAKFDRRHQKRTTLGRAKVEGINFGRKPKPTPHKQNRQPTDARRAMRC
jgi:DNA invertase Pin-like site-specific DNA recombinase